MLFFYITFALIMLAFAGFSIRNLMVHEFNMKVIGAISGFASKDIDNQIFNWSWRYETFDTVSYERMLFSLKPLRASSYWDDLSFLNGQDVKR